jgi:hypothetical protein
VEEGGRAAQQAVEYSRQLAGGSGLAGYSAQIRSTVQNFVETGGGPMNEQQAAGALDAFSSETGTVGSIENIQTILGAASQQAVVTGTKDIRPFARMVGRLVNVGVPTARAVRIAGGAMGAPFGERVIEQLTGEYNRAGRPGTFFEFAELFDRSKIRATYSGGTEQVYAALAGDFDLDAAARETKLRDPLASLTDRTANAEARAELAQQRRTGLRGLLERNIKAEQNEYFQERGTLGFNRFLDRNDIDLTTAILNFVKAGGRPDFLTTPLDELEVAPGEFPLFALTGLQAQAGKTPGVSNQELINLVNLVYQQQAGRPTTAELE